jgi:hypothetical protein
MLGVLQGAHLEHDVVEGVQGVGEHRVKGQPLDGDAAGQAVEEAIQGVGDVLCVYSTYRHVCCGYIMYVDCMLHVHIMRVLLSNAA